MNRRRFLQGVGGIGLAGAAALSYAGPYEAGTALRLTSYDLTPPLWPQGFELKIAIIADIHACYPWMSDERVGDIVDLANAQKADLTVLLGDFVCTHRYVTGYVPPAAWAEQLARLEAPLGVYSVLGNHDWFSAAMPTDPPDGGDSVRQAIRAAGIPLLENSSIRLNKGKRAFWLVGLADQLARRSGRYGMFRVDDLAGSMKQIRDDAPAILLAHEPYIFDSVPDRIALTLSGHMHGGQVNLPFVGPCFIPGGPNRRKYVYGQYQKGKRTLLLSGGLGTSLLPLRVNMPPEVVVVRLGGDTAEVRA